VGEAHHPRRPARRRGMDLRDVNGDDLLDATSPAELALVTWAS
jgi:hypothetical protein